MIIIYVPTGSDLPDKREEQKQLVREFLEQGWIYQGNSVLTNQFNGQVEVTILEKRSHTLPVI